ncbi:MAG: DUF4870 family protein [Novosphingobium sp.]
MTDLSEPPPSMAPPQASAPQEPPPVAAVPQGGFDFNYPTIVSLLYLSSFILGITGLVGVVLAYVWRGESQAEWEASHYQYLINTFWIGLIGSLVSFVLIFVLIGIPMLLAVMALMVVRSVLSLVRAQKREPMPNPGTWLA